MEPPASSAPRRDDAPRLEGWKEIARHLGKGVRTTQRWEKEYGLPVHRDGPERNEPVYAFADELDEWLRRRAAAEADDDAPSRLSPDRPTAAPADEPPAAPSSRGRPLALAALALVAAAAIIVGLVAFRRTLEARRSAPGRAHPAGAPTAWQVTGDALLVRDAEGRALFVHHFGFELVAARSGDDPRRMHPPVQLVDVDGDGGREVLFVSPGLQRADHRLYCFEADGRLRFSLQPDGGMRFGDTEYRPPWLAFRAWATRRADGRPSLWAAFVHGYLFPTRVLELDPRSGGVRGEYWSNGHVVALAEGRLAGRDVVVLGGVNNETRGASLAILDRDGFGGHAPARRQEYACTACPGGVPRRFFVFPRSCVTESLDTTAVVRAVSFTAAGRLSVEVEEGHGRPGDFEANDPLPVRYEMDLDGARTAVEASPELVALHDAYAAAGRLDHRFGAADSRALARVLRFEGGGFVPLGQAR